MTPPEYLAGRALDALIAEKIFGAPNPTTFAPPPYSTSIECAWTVVEILASCHPVIARQTLPDKWRVVMDPHSDDMLRPRVQKYAETAPLAICRAALAAVGSP